VNLSVRELALLGAAVLSIFFGFVPTGVVATVYAARACSLAAQGRPAGGMLAGAAAWLTTTVVIGVAVEVPVVAAMLHS